MWGTYFGGSQLEYLNSNFSFGSPVESQSRIFTTDDDQLLINGYTKSVDGIKSDECMYETINVFPNGFLANINANKGTLHWSTYFDAEINSFDLIQSHLGLVRILIGTRANISDLVNTGSHKPDKIGLNTSGLLGILKYGCTPNTPRLSYTYPDLSVDTGYESYTWYHNGGAVSSGDSDTYAPGVDTTGFYYAVVQKCGCNYTTDTFYFDDMSISNQDFAQHFQLYPNPTEHSVQLRVLNPNLSLKETDIYVYNLLGQAQAIKIVQLGAQQYQIDLKGLPAGTYHILLRNQKGQWSQKVVKW